MGERVVSAGASIAAIFGGSVSHILRHYRRKLCLAPPFMTRFFATMSISPTPASFSPYRVKNLLLIVIVPLMVHFSDVLNPRGIEFNTRLPGYSLKRI